MKTPSKFPAKSKSRTSRSAKGSKLPRNSGASARTDWPNPLADAGQQQGRATARTRRGKPSKANSQDKASRAKARQGQANTVAKRAAEDRVNLPALASSPMRPEKPRAEQIAGSVGQRRSSCCRLRPRPGPVTGPRTASRPGPRAEARATARDRAVAESGPRRVPNPTASGGTPAPVRRPKPKLKPAGPKTDNL